MTTTGATQHQLCRPVAAFLFFEYCANQTLDDKDPGTAMIRSCTIQPVACERLPLSPDN